MFLTQNLNNHQCFRNVDGAVDSYFTNGYESQVKGAKSKYNATKARQFYDSLKPGNESTWNTDSIMDFYTAIKVDAETDIVVFLIMKHMEVTNAEEITYTEFENACKSIGCDDQSSW